MRNKSVLPSAARTAKNGMVADHYEKLGFQLVSRDPVTESSTWVLSIRGYENRNRHITLKGAVV